MGAYLKQKLVFDEAGGSSVAILEGVNPGDVQVSQDRGEDRHGPFQRCAERVLAHVAKPLAQPVEKVGAVLCRCTSVVVPHDDAGRTDRAGRSVTRSCQILQDYPVELGDPVDGEHQRALLHNVVHDPVVASDDVVDLLTKVFLRRRELQLVVYPLSHLLLGQRVAFDLGGGVRSLRQENPAQLFSGLRLERDSRPGGRTWKEPRP